VTRLLAVLVLGACGRVDFDPLHDGSIDAPVSPCDASDPDLVACYAFDGDTLDSSSYHNDAASSAVVYLAGVNGQAAHVDGSSTILAPKSPSLDVTTAFTFDFWVNLDSQPAVATRMMFLDNNGDYGMALHPGQIECAGPANFHFLANATIPTATWTHIGCIYDNTAIAIWLGDAMIGTAPLTGSNNTSGPTGLQIAQNTPDTANPGPDPLLGALDQLRIWRIASACAVAGSC
jgi:hypothetical protein